MGVDNVSGAGDGDGTGLLCAESSSPQSGWRNLANKASSSSGLLLIVEADVDDCEDDCKDASLPQRVTSDPVGEEKLLGAQLWLLFSE